MPMEFEHNEQFNLTDSGSVQDLITRLLWRHRLYVTDPSSRLDARIWSRRIQNITLNDVFYGADVTIVTEEPESFFAIMMPFSGTSVIRRGGLQLRAEYGLAAIANPAEPLSMRWSADCAQRIVRIEQPALEAHLSDMLGHPLTSPLEFTLRMDLTEGDARIFAEEITRVVSLLDREPHAFDQPLSAASVEQLLMTRLLQGAQHNYRDMLGVERVTVPSAIVREAVDLIENHPEWDHTVGSLAREIGVSRRSLERAFRRYMGVSPWKYVKSVRLRRAHDQLIAADPSEVTIGEVARRWGMSHSQFTAEYHRAYGETPTQTLSARARPTPPQSPEPRQD